MPKNILRESNVTNIFIVYTFDNVEYKYKVKLRFQDDKSSFLVTNLNDGFVPPVDNIAVKLIVYTTEGQYKCETTLLNSILNKNEILFETAVAENWEFNQLRMSWRYNLTLPIEVECQSGNKINVYTNDISKDGVSFYSDNELPEDFCKRSCIVRISIPQSVEIPIQNNILEFTSSFVRKGQNLNTHKVRYVYKFLDEGSGQQTILDRALNNLDK